MDRPLSPYSPMSPVYPFNRPLSSYAYPSALTSPIQLPYDRSVWSPQAHILPQQVHYPPVSNPEPTKIPAASLIAPPRPSSAKPERSQPLHDFRDDVSFEPMHRPLLPLVISETQEGKGERATRIAHHLRMSSRGRSASPPSHCYTVTTMPNPHSHFAVAVAASAQLDTCSPPLQSTDTTQAISPKLSVSPVLSPRPMLSPTHSFTEDHATPVATLERIAARLSEEKSGGPSLDKTLPSLPSTNKAHTVRPDARSLFPHAADEQAAMDKPCPPTPKIGALTSPRALWTNPEDSISPPRILSGLDALEAKLLAEVGTRKLEQTERHPDVRTVLPVDIPRAKVDPPNDSAISSLALPGLEPEEGTLYVGWRSEKNGLSNEGDKEDNINAPLDISRKRSSERVSDQPTPLSLRSARRTKGGRKSGEQGADAVKDAEMHKLRKAAQGRIAAWLDSVDSVSPTQLESPSFDDTGDLNGIIDLTCDNLDDAQPQDPPDHPQDLVHDAASAVPSPQSSGFVPIGSVQATISRSRFMNSRSSHVQSQSTAQETRHKASEASQPPVPDLRAVLAAGARYDARSARGGRGGKVTSIAAIWATATQGEGKSSPHDNLSPIHVSHAKRHFVSPKPFQPRPRQVTTQSPMKPSLKIAFRPLVPPRRLSGNSSSHSSTSASPDTQTKPMSFASLVAKGTDIVKSPSVPAVISSSLAKPMFSSTASLARPIPPLLDRNKVNVLPPPAISESRSPSKTSLTLNKPVGKTELVFGQARLRELIQRYQGGGS